MRLAATAVVSALMLAAGAAHAEPPAYSYEIENLDQHAGQQLVVWPRTCAASGEPIGALDLSLNPDWASRMNEIDYEVVVPGKKHTLLEHCRTTSRLFALSATAFPKATRAATADDTLIGQKTGEMFAILPALDAIDIKKRIEFFASDPRALRTTFRFEPVKPERGAQAVHDVLRVEDFGEKEFKVVLKRVVYTYPDGGTESVSTTVPTPTPSASASPAPTPPPPQPDGGTRWVLLAAIAGLCVGGVIAYFRRQKATSK